MKYNKRWIDFHAALTMQGKETLSSSSLKCGWIARRYCCGCSNSKLMYVVRFAAQSYRKIPAVRRDKKPGARPNGLTEEQKQEIRRAPTAVGCSVYQTRLSG